MKQSIGVIVMTVLMGALVMFGMKACTGGSGDNFGNLDYSQTGNEVVYTQIEPIPEIQTISASTTLVAYQFTTEGAALSSYKVKSSQDPNKQVELIISYKNKFPFRFFWGNDRLNPDKAIYQHQDLSTDEKHIHQFTATILDNDKKSVEIIKTFTMLNDSYMWTLDVEFKTEMNRIPNIGSQGYAYSVYYGPQLGPEYKKLSKKNAQYAEERLIHENYTDQKGKVKSKNLMRSEMIGKTQKTTDGSDILYYREDMKEKRMNWVALTGKHFLFIAEIPRQIDDLFYASNSVDEKNENFEMIYENEFFLSQHSFSEKNLKDVKAKFYFYMGPRNSGVLKTSEKSFGRNDLDFSSLSSKGFLGLSVLVEKTVGFINYGLKINNWGWAIIIFTIILKLLLFGLQRKSYDSMGKMQELAPKITALKEKYKDNPQELQLATSTLYKEEKINPMGGCLPLLIQMPILIAIYTFINNSYEMKGEPFIWWIKDLSSPDAIINFANPLPLLGWKSLNLLPIIYIITQLLSTIMMKPKKVVDPNAPKKKLKLDSQQTQMFLMQYGMPLIFFFVLYGAPAGLFVYWITMNILTIIQQLYYNKFLKNRPKKGKKVSNKLYEGNKIKKQPSKKR